MLLLRKDAEQYGLAQRNRVRRSALSKLAERSFDSLEILRQACRGHVSRLVPVKFERMKASPFAFFRGGVEVMAADLGAAPSTAIEVQLCGDAHPRNFGFFATPSADIVLDLNDFDHTQRGPWEWDIKRMAASIVVVGRTAGDTEVRSRESTRLFVSEYATWIRRFARMPNLEVSRHKTARNFHDPAIRKALQKGERSTPEYNLRKLTAHSRTGSYHFITRPTLTWEITGKERRAVLSALPAYRKTLSVEHQLLFDRYRTVDVAFKVVGTGSVGTRDYVVLLFGRDQDDPLFLQIKEESPSAYGKYYKDGSSPKHQGERVVRGQHTLQLFSDMLLGWCSIENRDYLVRQLCDHKSSVKPEELSGSRLVEYSLVCAELLAKGHARSAEPAVLASYLGRSDKAQRALVDFAVSYADQNDKDYSAFLKALKNGFVEKVLNDLR